MTIKIPCIYCDDNLCYDRYAVGAVSEGEIKRTVLSNGWTWFEQRGQAVCPVCIDKRKGFSFGGGKK